MQKTINVTSLPLQGSYGGFSDLYQCLWPMTRSSAKYSRKFGSSSSKIRQTRIITASLLKKLRTEDGMVQPSLRNKWKFETLCKTVSRAALWLYLIRNFRSKIGGGFEAIPIYSTWLPSRCWLPLRSVILFAFLRGTDFPVGCFSKCGCRCANNRKFWI